MKRILLLATFITSAVATFAQGKNNGPANNNRQYNSYSSALALNTATNQQFTVVIDNGYQYQSNGNTVYIPDMNAGNHNVTVFEYRRNIFGAQRQRVIYSATVYFKPGIEHNLFINQFGQANFEERPLYQNNGGYGNNGNGKGWGYGRQKDKHNKQKNNCDDDDRDSKRGKW